MHGPRDVFPMKYKTGLNGWCSLVVGRVARCFALTGMVLVVGPKLSSISTVCLSSSNILQP